MINDSTRGVVEAFDFVPEGRARRVAYRSHPLEHVLGWCHGLAPHGGGSKSQLAPEMDEFVSRCIKPPARQILNNIARLGS